MTSTLSTQSALLVRPDITSFTFQTHVRTDAAGFSKLVGFKQRIDSLTNRTIQVGWLPSVHFDANLSAILLALMTQASRQNGLSFVLDELSLTNKHEVFARNGLVQAVYNTPFLLDERASTIQVRRFGIDEVDEFINYIDNDMLAHSRLKSLPSSTIQRISSFFSEFFCNVEIHAETDEVFVCGQFFPNIRELRFTMVDLGCGFTKKITAQTQLTTGAEIIRWALSGNTTKTQAAGGSGLRTIITHCMQTNDSLHIVTDGLYWLYDPIVSRTSSCYPLSDHIKGTTVHMVFRDL